MDEDNRKDAQVDISERITSLTICIHMSKPKAKDVNRILKGLPNNGWTEIGTNFKTRVLEELVYKPIENNALKRPVLIFIIADGHPQGPNGTKEARDTLKGALLECGMKLKEKGYDKIERLEEQLGELRHYVGTRLNIEESQL
ncbi:hypothetical protein V8C37DRAFT_400963 [Trichoderma ceciliae]